MNMKVRPESLEIGKRIKKCRKNLGMTQEKLEEVSGVSQNHISSLERGVSQLGLDALMKLAPALQVSMEYLLTGKESESRLCPQTESFFQWLTEQDNETQRKISRILVGIRDLME